MKQIIQTLLKKKGVFAKSNQLNGAQFITKNEGRHS
jgi:hypothetical protein